MGYLKVMEGGLGVVGFRGMKYRVICVWGGGSIEARSGSLSYRDFFWTLRKEKYLSYYYCLM